MRKSNTTQRPAAFTLVELVLVMALLCIILAIAAPSLSRSMHERSLVQEATRLLALTEYARDEATSKGIPMVVWINKESGQYGVKAKTGYEDAGARAKQYTLTEGVRFDSVLVSTSTTGDMGTTANSNPTAGYQQTPGENDAVEFAPDGTLDPGSDTSLSLVDRSEAKIAVMENVDASEYQIVTNPQ
jgi:type II secretion system protein H